MSNWGDEVDEELQQNTDVKFGFLISFKSMLNAINLICDTQRNYDDKHPRDSFRKIWFGTLLMLLVFICLSYNILIIATLPFICFYGYVLIKLGRAYKQFGYKTAPYWWTTAGAMVLCIGIAYFLRMLIFQ